MFEHSSRCTSEQLYTLKPKPEETPVCQSELLALMRQFPREGISMIRTSGTPYNVQSRQYTYFASDVALDPKGIRDAVGVLVEHLGDAMWFKLNRVEVQDGDLKWIELTPTDRTLQLFPRVAGITIVVYND